MKIFWLVLVLSVFLIGDAAAQTVAPKTEISLNSGWKFREAGKSEWLPATVPGCVHTDLLANKKIDDPFYRDNERQQQWMAYRKQAIVEPRARPRLDRTLDRQSYGLPRREIHDLIVFGEKTIGNERHAW